MSDPTVDTPAAVETPEWPEWADRFFAGLYAAIGGKADAAEWQAEDGLLAAASLIVRARLGRTGAKDPFALARWHISKALEALDAEDARQ